MPRDDTDHKAAPADGHASGPLTGLKLAIVLKGYPRLSETFIAQEIEGLEHAGADVRLVSLRHPTDSHRHPVHDRVQAEVLYLPEYLYQEPWRVLTALLAMLRNPRLRSVLGLWWRDFKRDRSANRIRRLGQALVLAHELPGTADLLYAHFIHTPCSVTRYAARLLDLPFAISAHAKDIYTSEDWELVEKLDDALWTVTCTAGNCAHLRPLTKRPEAVHLVYHGLDTTDLVIAEQEAAKPVGNSGLRLLTVGRAVRKKGLDTILQALAQLPDELDWHWHHAGGGELLADLKAEADRLGIASRITWHGSQPRDVIRDLYNQADLFLIASRVTGNGDRDGLPNVLMEAASFAVPAIGTRVGALPEFIEHDVSGWLIEPDDVPAMAAAIAGLAADRTRLERYGRAAALRLQTGFAFNHCLDPLVNLLQAVRETKADTGSTTIADLPSK